MDQTETPAPGEAPIMRPLGAGDPAPTFVLPDPDDVMISSADLLKNGPLVVTFYRGIWCPYCRQDLKHLGNAAPDIRSCGASLVAIAHQTVPDSNGKFQRKLGWNFRSSTTVKAMSQWRTGSAGRRRSWRPPKSGSGSFRA